MSDQEALCRNREGPVLALLGPPTMSAFEQLLRYKRNQTHLIRAGVHNLVTNPITRRSFAGGALGVCAALADGGTSVAQTSQLAFAQWAATFRARAQARGVSDAT